MSVAACIVSGGDESLEILPRLGMNKFNVPNAPAPGINRGSCTSSMPSTKAFAIGPSVLARLEAPSGAAEVAADIRDRLRKAWSLQEMLGYDGLPLGTCVTLSPSGTEVEFLFLLLALGRAFSGKKQGDVTSIVTCAGEVGGTTTQASGGRHASERLPSGSQAKIGTSIFSTDAVASRVKAVEVTLRETNGDLRSPADVDREVEASAKEALAPGGGCCIVHLVAGCRTGHVSPSVAACERLRRHYGGRILLLVDASQARLRDGAIRELLERGFGVLATGSKFYAGPAFSGAAIMREEMAKELDGYLASGPLRDAVIQSALKEYLGAPLVDSTFMPALAQLLSGAGALVNGTLLRWSLSLVHIEDYHSVPADERDQLIGAWHRDVTTIIERIGYGSIGYRRALSILSEELHPFGAEVGLLASSTITSTGHFTSTIINLQCRVFAGGKWRMPTMDELRHAHRLMALDLGQQAVAFMPRRRCFIADPVALGSEGAPILSVAIGASEILEAHAALRAAGTLGSTEITWPLSEDDETALKKLAGLLGDWDRWSSNEAVSSEEDLVKYKFYQHEAQLQGLISTKQLGILFERLGMPITDLELQALLQAFLSENPRCVDIKTGSVKYETFMDFILMN